MFKIRKYFLASKRVMNCANLGNATISASLPAGRVILKKNWFNN